MKNDHLIHQRHLEKNLNAISNAGEMKNTSYFSLLGKHGESSLKIQASALDYYEDGKLSPKRKELISKIITLENSIKAYSKKFYEPITKLLNEVLKEIKEKGETEDLIKSKVVREGELKSSKDTLEYHTKILEQLKDELKKIENEIINLFPVDMDAEQITRQERTAENQISHFLKKAGLSDDIIKK